MRLFAFSSDALPERERIDGTVDVIGSFGHKVRFGRDASDFRFQLECRGYANVQIFATRVSSGLLEIGGCDRPPEQLAIDFKDTSGDFAIRYRGVETAHNPGGVSLYEMGLPLVHMTRAPSSGITIAVPLEDIFRRLRTKDSIRKTSLHGNSPGLRLLRHYVDGVNIDGALATEAERQLFASHVCDLVALILGPTSDAAEQVRNGGLLTARLQAAEDYINAHLFQPSLSDRSVAAHLGVSDRYVRMLFASTGTSCKKYIDGQRLAASHAMLTNPLYAARKIIDLAHTCGFNDVSAFNRQFRARFGMTPSDARNGSGWKSEQREGRIATRL